RRIGPYDEALYNELIHVPWLLRMPDGSGAAGRSQTLAQPADLCVTLCDLWGVSAPRPSSAGKSLLPVVRDDIETLRDRACVVSPEGELGIRTAGWYLRVPAVQPAAADGIGAGPAELYAKPDDFWD